MEIDLPSSPVLTTMTCSQMSVKVQLHKLHPRPLPDNEIDWDPLGNIIHIQDDNDDVAKRSNDQADDDEDEDVEIVNSDNLSDLYEDRTGNNYDACHAGLLKFPGDIPLNSRTVTLDGNNISSIPESFLNRSIPPLIILSIANNKLRYLPSNLAELQPTLKYLNISHNLLDRLPISITQLTQLRTLLIDHNNFTSIPTQIAELSNLNELGLDWFTYTGGSDGVLRLKRGLERFLETLKAQQQGGQNGQISPRKRELLSFGDYMEISTGRRDWIHDKYCTKRAIPGNSPQDDLTFSSIIHKAVISNDYGVLKDLLNYLKKNDIYLEWQDIDGFTPFAAALECGHVTLARMLLNHGINLQIKQKDASGTMVKSGLLVAVERGLTQIVKEMLHLGADPNECDLNGNTALHLIFAAMSSNIPRYVEILQILLSHEEIKLNLPNFAGFTPLHAAVSANQICSIQYALDFNSCRNPLVDQQIQQNNKFDVMIKNAEGLNVAEMAYIENALEIMETLIVSNESFLEDIDHIKLGNDRFSLSMHKSLAKMRAKYNRVQVRSMARLPSLYEKQHEKHEIQEKHGDKKRTLSKRSNTSTKSGDSNTTQIVVFDVLEAQQRLTDSDELLSKRFKQINPLLLMPQTPLSPRKAPNAAFEQETGPHSVLRSLLNYQLLSHERLGMCDKVLFNGIICAAVHESNNWLLNLIAEISTIHPISFGTGHDLSRFELFQAAIGRLLKCGRWPFKLLQRRVSLRERSMTARYVHTEPAEDQMFEGRYNQRYETQIC